MALPTERWVLLDAGARRACPLRFEWQLAHWEWTGYHSHARRLCEDAVAALRSMEPVRSGAAMERGRVIAAGLSETFVHLREPYFRFGAISLLGECQRILAPRRPVGDSHGRAGSAAAMIRSVFVVGAHRAYDLLREIALPGVNVNAVPVPQSDLDRFWTDLCVVTDVEVQESKYKIFSEWSSEDRDRFFIPIIEDLAVKHGFAL